MYQKKIKETNEKRVLHFIYQNKNRSLSVAEISNQLNISFPTAKNIISNLLELSIIKTDLKSGNGSGRKAQNYILNKNFLFGVGVEVTSSHLKIALINEIGFIYKELIIKDKFLNERFIEKIDEAIEDFLSNIENNVKEKISGIGISIPGIVDKENNIVEITEKIRVSLDEIEKISEKFQIKILIDNAGNLCALGEKFLGIGAHYQNFICINLGTALTMSNFVEDSVSGNFFFKATRLNHLSINFEGIPCECGNFGCLGKYISKKVLIENFSKKFPQVKNLKNIFESDILKTDEGKEILENYLKFLAVGIKNIIFLYNPECLILSGEITKYKNVFEKELAEKIYSNNIFFKGQEILKYSNLERKNSLLGAALFPIVDKLF